MWRHDGPEVAIPDASLVTHDPIHSEMQVETETGPTNFPSHPSLLHNRSSLSRPFLASRWVANIPSTRHGVVGSQLVMTYYYSFLGRAFPEHRLGPNTYPLETVSSVRRTV